MAEGWRGKEGERGRKGGGRAREREREREKEREREVGREGERRRERERERRQEGGREREREREGERLVIVHIHCIPYYSRKFGGLAVYITCNRQIKICQNFLLAYIRMAIRYRTTKFKSSNILAIAILGSTAKFNSRQYFQLYSIKTNIPRQS